MKVTKYPFRELVLDERCQARTEKYPEAIDDYAAAYRDKAELPPIDVFLVNGVPWVVDGFHRVAALAVTRTEWVRCRVLGDGTEEQAVWQALAANKANGIRRTNADKRKAVLTALESAIGADQSSRVIAEHVGVSHDFVSRVRAEWESRHVSSDDTSNQLSSDDNSKRVGKDGKKYSVRSGRSRKDAQNEESAVNTDETGDRQMGGQLSTVDSSQLQTVSSPEHVSSDDSSELDEDEADLEIKNALLADVKELLGSEPVSNADQLRESAPDQLPPYGDELERAATAIGRLRVELRRYELPNRFVQAIESGLKGVESTLRYAVPETCPRCQGTRCIHCRDRGWVERAEGDQLRASAKAVAR